MQAQTQKTVPVQPKPDPKNPFLVEAQKLFDRLKAFTQMIERRAYHFFEERGQEPGDDLADWFRAEMELMRPVAIDIREDAKNIFIRAEVPGFEAEEIKVSVDPQCVILCGEAENTEERKTNDGERFAQWFGQFYRTIELPTAIEPDKTTAGLKNGVLELTLIKAAPAESVNVEVKAS
jgi:HSP20 family protein